jgi:hypothetical protein
MVLPERNSHANTIVAMKTASRNLLDNGLLRFNQAPNRFLRTFRQEENPLASCRNTALNLVYQMIARR